MEAPLIRSATAANIEASKDNVKPQVLSGRNKVVQLLCILMMAALFCCGPSSLPTTCTQSFSLWEQLISVSVIAMSVSKLIANYANEVMFANDSFWKYCVYTKQNRHEEAAAAWVEFREQGGALINLVNICAVCLSQVMGGVTVILGIWGGYMVYAETDAHCRAWLLSF
eukprot:gnl/TRDRNA2_/TRDRNA2_201426_c0_seq1.p1 gnl/TRDRNA2_/TRDRNA2_201426_c0~~gnl/TRDRNA2_/TRDRNA2_201426_c0_seq1.p1  ORF type:complete len:182 (+),score=19.83 gnl/TRDRNA2_/TRDRNA2_201426_c0_seq1:42-548(+)